MLEPYNSMIEGFQRPVDISVRNCLGEKEIGEKGEKAMGKSLKRAFETTRWMGYLRIAQIAAAPVLSATQFVDPIGAL